MRTKSLGRPLAALTSAGMEAWLMKHGMLQQRRQPRALGGQDADWNGLDMPHL
jgi:hypothetical protein